VQGGFALLQVDEEVGDESQGLLLHQPVHVFLADLDSRDINTLHSTIAYPNTTISTNCI